MSTALVRVLLVEDDEDDYVLTHATLAQGYGSRFRVDWVNSYSTGLERLVTGEYDVALVDHNLGSETGIELLRSAYARGCRVPVIILTGQDDRATDLNAMHAGAADYLVKGRVTGDMLERAIRYARERQRLLDEIRWLSLSDDLTGLSNRRAFFTLAEQRLLALERSGAPCMLLFADVDGLKQANDTLGHDVGDTLLVDAARVLLSVFRRTDLIARLGGDEFVVLADHTTDGDVQTVLDRLQHQVSLRNAETTEGPPLAISAGALCFRGSVSASLQQLVADADALMLQCKKDRRSSRSRLEPANAGV